MRVLNQFTARETKFKGEVNNGPSQTIPDQAVSPQELLRRYATGQPLGFKSITPVYDEDENYDVPELYKMDKLDRLHELQQNSDDLIELKTDYDTEVQQYKENLRKQAEKAKQEQKESDNRAQNAANSKRSEENAA